MKHTKEKTQAKKLADAKLDTYTGKFEGLLAQPNIQVVSPLPTKAVRIPELNMSVRLKPGHTVREFIIKYVANNPLKKKRLYDAYNITYEEELAVNPTKTLKGSTQSKKKEEFFQNRK